MKKIFAVNNGSSTDFNLEEDLVAGGSNAHSGGAVIIADNLEEAKKILDRAIVDAGSYNLEDRNIGTLKEIKLNKSGVLLFADGDC